MTGPDQTSGGDPTIPVYCKTLDEALREVRRRSGIAPKMISKYEKSPYGGYRVYSIDADDFVDDLVDPLPGKVASGFFRLYR